MSGRLKELSQNTQMFCWAREFRVSEKKEQNMNILEERGVLCTEIQEYLRKMCQIIRKALC